MKIKIKKRIKSTIRIKSGTRSTFFKNAGSITRTWKSIEKRSP